MAARRVSIAERLERYVDKTNDCWLWTGYRERNGYGRICVLGRPIAVHRAAWELHNGPIPQGLHVCHRCDVRACVNPGHLFVGTCAENQQDASRKGRKHYGSRHHCSKLTADQVLQIRTLHATGVAARELARRYHVRSTTIDRIAHRRTWKFVHAA